MQGKFDEGPFYCPVCGHQLPGEYFEYEICPRCRWEDDPGQRDDPDSMGANQDVTLNQAIANYNRTGKAKPKK